jgi:hypothetical protein
MYCEDSLGTDIEHFEPRERAPSRTFDWSNHLWACSYCNSNAKRTQYPVDAQGAPLLLDPTVDDPREHLRFTPTTGAFVSSGPKGEPSIEVFGLNRFERERGRFDAWTVMSELMVRYHQLHATGKTDRSARILVALKRSPFQAVRLYLIDLARRNDPESLLGEDVLNAIRACPELLHAY